VFVGLIAWRPKGRIRRRRPSGPGVVGHGGVCLPLVAVRGRSWAAFPLLIRHQPHKGPLLDCIETSRPSSKFTPR